MTRVCLAGSINSFYVSVIDFSTPSAVPPAVLVNGGLGSSCTVDLSGAFGVIGASTGPVPSGVRGIDVSDPSAPTLGPVVPTQLSGIGAVAAHGTIAAAGELNGDRVVLVDLAMGKVLAIESTTINGITSAGFCGPRRVVVAGASFNVAIIDFSVTPPTVSYVAPGVGAPLVVAGDVNAGLFAIGDTTGTTAMLYDSSGALQAKVSNICPNGTFSIGLEGDSALYGSTNDLNVYLVDFLAGGSTVFLSSKEGPPSVNRSGNDGVCGLVSNPGVTSPVTLFDLGVNPPSHVAQQDSGIPSINSIAVGSFSRKATWSPAAIVFGSVEVGASAQGTLSITNSGTVPLSVSGVASSSPQFAATSQVPSVLQPGQTGIVQVIFRPAVAAGYSANLTFQTNDPNHATVSVPMEGTGVPSTVTWTPLSIDFGTVSPNSPVTRSLSISNNRATDLNVTNIKVVTSEIPAELSVSVSALVVHPGQAQTIVVTFNPKVVWPWGHQFAADLVFQTDSPAHPNGDVPLSGSVAAWGCLGAPMAVSATAVKAVATRLRKLARQA